jgi:hypothetical protein
VQPQSQNVALQLQNQCQVRKAQHSRNIVNRIALKEGQSKHVSEAMLLFDVFTQ